MVNLSLHRFQSGGTDVNRDAFGDGIVRWDSIVIGWAAMVLSPDTHRDEGPPEWFGDMMDSRVAQGEEGTTGVLWQCRALGDGGCQHGGRGGELRDHGVSMGLRDGWCHHGGGDGGLGDHGVSVGRFGDSGGGCGQVSPNGFDSGQGR